MNYATHDIFTTRLCSSRRVLDRSTTRTQRIFAAAPYHVCSLRSGDRRLLRARGELFRLRGPRDRQRRARNPGRSLWPDNGSGIVEALVRAKQRGIDVRLIADKTTPRRRASGIGALADVGVPIWIDDQPRIAHAKTIVIDGAVTLMGSYNWTTGAARNSEDLNFVSCPTVAAAYVAHWRERLAISVRFDRREDWCWS